MKEFEKPTLEVVEFTTTDIIVTSVAEPIYDRDNARESASDIAKLTEDFWF